MSTENEYRITETAENSTDGGQLAQRDLHLKTRESFFLPANELEGYEKVVRGSGKKIFQLFIQQAEHRMEIEKEEMQHRHKMKEEHLEKNADHRDILVGFGLIAFLAMIALAVFFAFMKMEAAAIAAIALPTLQGIAQLIRSVSLKGDESPK